MKHMFPEALVYMDKDENSFLALKNYDEVVWYKNVDNGWEGLSVEEAKKVSQYYQDVMEKEIENIS